MSVSGVWEFFLLVVVNFFFSVVTFILQSPFIQFQSLLSLISNFSGPSCLPVVDWISKAMETLDIGC